MSTPVVDPPLTDLSKYPWATMLIVLFSIIGGLVVIFDGASLSFENYLTTVLGAAAALSIGRGLAYKDSGVAESPLSRVLNSIPWATVLVGVFSLVGGVVLLLGDSSLNFEEYLTRVLAASAVLGVGRGIASYKRDSSLVNTDPIPAEVPVEYVEAEPVFTEDDTMGAEDEPEGTIGGAGESEKGV